MSKIYLYAHGGSGNHGCEAIVRSTVGILNKITEKEINLITARPDEDIKYGIKQIGEFIQEKQLINKKCIDFIIGYLSLKLFRNYKRLDELEYKEAFRHVSKGDIALSIGGDNYCYADVSRYVMMHDLLIKRGAKTVLWGCSVEPSVVARPDISLDLSKYDLIVTRESISYEALKKVNSNTILVPDPAFTLEMTKIDLPENFIEGNTVGINLSPMVIDNESIKGITMKSYERLIEYIINETDMTVALIPHVVWESGDDRKPLRALYEKFKHTNRVILFEDNSCDKLKYIISKCKYFIGARTHSTIAAYSKNVPTLVVGYSVKARGIAKDIFGEENKYIVPVQEIINEDSILKEFISVVNNEEEIIKCLKVYNNKNVSEILEKVQKTKIFG